ncbi:MAG TPA: glycoside hydrolase family 9 protein [Bryobacteraceae bacterium]|nr:glycoside hydrolase family 9 protein [Bryobacteraceae bacterium]
MKVRLSEKLLAAFGCLLMPALAADPTTLIKLDQAGYLPALPKVALVSVNAPASDFTVRRAQGGSVVFRAKLGAPVDDADSGDRLQAADFSSLTSNGSYYILVPGIGRSWDFAIGPDVYARPWYLAMRSYYGQRCGIAVDLGPEFPGFRHAACHLEGAWHPSSGKTGPRESKGGWHDAGDYGRYVVNSGISTGTLLWTWEFFGTRLAKVTLKLPESGNGTPDILNEIRWNLDWMLTMQDEDGGVWHKQTSEQFCPFIMPEADKLVSYVIGTSQDPYKSSCATGDFAAVMAIAERLYKPYDAAFAERALRAAERAWRWLDRHPDVTFRNPPGVGTGEYGDRNCGDERLWAAAELFRTTGAAAYQKFFLDSYAEYSAAIKPVSPQSWANVANLALWTYVLAKGADSAAAAAIRRDSIAAADQLVARSTANGYRISMTPRDYIWGSNSVLANYGIQLLVADAFQHNPRYVETAVEDLHYLLGRNTFSLSFVTRVGANSFRHPHHRPSGADDNPEPWPGLLSGGPNRGRQDNAMRRLLAADLPPAKVYVDDQEAYAANEVAINWNAPLVFLLAAALPAK